MVTNIAFNQKPGTTNKSKREGGGSNPLQIGMGGRAENNRQETRNSTSCEIANKLTTNPNNMTKSKSSTDVKIWI